LGISKKKKKKQRNPKGVKRQRGIILFYFFKNKARKLNAHTNCFHKVIAYASIQANVSTHYCKLVLRTTQSNVLTHFAYIFFALNPKANKTSKTQHKESNNQ
jgi:hypothetical protein